MTGLGLMLYISFRQPSTLLLLLVVSMKRIVDGEMQTTTLLALYCLTCDEVAHVYHVSKFTDILARLHPLEERLCLFIEQVETVPCTFQSEVTSHDAHIVAHYLSHFLHALRDEHFLLIGQGALVVPLRHMHIEVIFINVCQTVLCSRIGIYHSLDERVACQTVASVKSCA